LSATASLLADTICRTVELGVTITDAAVAGEFTHLFCSPVSLDLVCADCGTAGRLRDHVKRKVTDLPIVGHPGRLHVRVPRFTGDHSECETRILQQPMPSLAEPQARPPGGAPAGFCNGWRSTAPACRLPPKRSGWDLVNDLAISKVRTLVYDQPGHFDRVRVLGVDEHKWKHVRGDGTSSFVTVLVDLTPVVDGTGPARLLDMVQGRSAKVLTDWLDDRDQAFRDRVKVVTMDGFAGYHTAAAKAVPAARTVMDTFHVVHLAADKLTLCRQRVQQATTGHRGRAGDPLYKIRRALLSRQDLLTGKQKIRLWTAFVADDAHVAVEVSYSIYQQLIDAYEQSGRREGKVAMYKLLKSIRSGVPKELLELAQFGRSLWKRRREILAYFDVGASNGPVEAINGRLEHLRGIALGFRNLGHYILRSLIHSGQLQARINAL
jgi:transposase